MTSVPRSPVPGQASEKAVRDASEVMRAPHDTSNDPPNEKATSVLLELSLPPETEEWAEDVLCDFDIRRTDEALVVTYEVEGDCNAVTNAAGFLRDVEDALAEGGISPAALTLTARSKP